MAVITNITIGGVRYEVADATSGFVTRMVDDLQNYYRKSEVDERLSAIPKFAITVVDSLPTENISPTTVYLMKTGDEDRNLFSEFIYAGEKWEMLGTQSVDLTPYAKREDVDAELAQKATVERVNALEVEVAKKASQADLDKANQAIDQQDKDLATKAETAEVETLKAKVETKADKANTLTGYGITDAYTKSEVDTEVAKKADKSDTLAGYGITDAVTKSELQQVLQTEGVQADWAQSDETQKSFIQNKPDLTQFVNAETAGSIADSKVKSNLSLYVKQTDLNQALQTKADKSTTLAGYGIEDAYTKTEVDGKLKTSVGDKYVSRYGDRGVLSGYSTAKYIHIVEDPKDGSSDEARDLAIFEMECEEWYIDVDRNSFGIGISMGLFLMDGTKHIDLDWTKPKCKTIVFTFNFKVDSSIEWGGTPLYWVGGEAPAIGKAGSKAIVVLRTLGDFAVGSLYWSSEGN